MIASENVGAKTYGMDPCGEKGLWNTWRVGSSFIPIASLMNGMVSMSLIYKKGLCSNPGKTLEQVEDELGAYRKYGANVEV